MSAKKKAAPLKVEMWALDLIKPYERNAKIHTTDQVVALARIIQREGWNQPIVIDKNGVIIKGHGRRLAAVSLGLTEVPVHVADYLSDAEVRAARIADNRSASLVYDTELLASELNFLSADGFDMADTGFSDKELEVMLRDLGETNEDAFAGVDTSGAGSAPSAGAAGEKLGGSKETAQDDAGSISADIAVTDALGFKKLPDVFQRSVATFVALAEDKTGKTGGEAFGEYVSQLIADVASGERSLS